MTFLRQTPLGFVVDDRPEGLYLVGDERVVLRGLIRVADAGNYVRLDTRDDGKYLAEIGYGPDRADGVAEWGVGRTIEEAWRYALGAHYGSHDDPPIQKENDANL